VKSLGVGLAAWLCADVVAFAVPAEQAEDLDGSVPAEPNQWGRLVSNSATSPGPDCAAHHRSQSRNAQ